LFIDISAALNIIWAMRSHNAADEDWELLTTFFPAEWRHLAQTTGALKGLRQDKGEENYLRVLMLHFGCGLSMRETVVRAKQANLAELSSVALFNGCARVGNGSMG